MSIMDLEIIKGVLNEIKNSSKPFILSNDSILKIGICSLVLLAGLGLSAGLSLKRHHDAEKREEKKLLIEKINKETPPISNEKNLYK